MRANHSDLRGLSTCTYYHALRMPKNMCKITIDFGFVLLTGVNGISSLDTVSSEHEGNQRLFTRRDQLTAIFNSGVASMGNR